MDPHNPYRAEHKITLADGLEHTLRFDCNALVLLEEASGFAISQFLLLPPGFRPLRAAIFAGLAHERPAGRGVGSTAPPGPWTLEAAGALIHPRDLLAIYKTVRDAILEAILGPEAERKSPEPEASGSAAALPGGRGKKR